MEDKELQELFDAKRTTLANQHRQERMAAALGAGKQKRSLWPLWVGTAAAAAVAIVLLLRPASQVIIDDTPIQVAHTIAPVLPEEEAPIVIQQHHLEPVKATSPIIPTDTIASLYHPVASVDTIVTIDSTPIVKPTVHRRRATRMVQQEAPRRESLLQILVERISIDTSDSPLIKCINIKTSTI